MRFMELPPRTKRRAIIPHAMILSAFALTLVVFRVADDAVTGKAKPTDPLGFTLFFLAAAFYLCWLPYIWKQAKGTGFELFVLPALMGLIFVYFYFVFQIYFVQPGATATATLLQLFVLICLACRAT